LKDQEEAQLSTFQKLLENFPVLYYVTLVSLLVTVDMGTSLYLVGKFIINNETGWIIFTFLLMVLTRIGYIIVVWVTSYDEDQSDRNKNHTPRPKRSFEGKTASIILAVLGLSVPLASWRIWHAEDENVDENVTQRSTSRRLEFARQHCMSLIEAVGLMFIHLYIVAFHDSNHLYATILLVSIICKAVSITIRFAQIIRSQMASFFRYNKKEAFLLLDVFGLFFSDLFLRPIGMILVMGSDEDLSIKAIVTCAYGFFCFLSGMIYHCMFDLPAYREYRDSRRSESSELRKYDNFQVVIRSSIQVFTLVPHFIYADGYIPRYWVGEQSWRVLVTCGFVLYYLSGTELRNSEVWVVLCIIASLLQVVTLWYYIKELNSHLADMHRRA